MEWEYKLTRQGFADALVELGAENPDVFVLDADLAKSTLTCLFRDEYPDRFFDIGIAEQNMANIAAGLALEGKIPYFSTYGVFAAGRAWEQIRTTICYGNLNVKVCGAHAGISVGLDGATHQALEDIATMRVLPNMTVFSPADYYECKKTVKAMAAIDGPCFVRFGREKVPVVTDESTPFEVGKAYTMREGTDVSVFATGTMVAEALDAAEVLEKEGINIEVINIHTIKPIDSEAILASVKKTGCAVTAEEHQVYGGFGSAVMEVLAQHYPVPVEMVAIMDTFGETGQPRELMEKYGITGVNIVEKVKKVLARK